MRLLVTGHDARGKAVFSHVGTPPRELHPGSYDLWSTRGAQQVPNDADPKAPADIGYFPALGETSFKIVSVPPDAGVDASSGGDVAEFFDADDPQMHTTDTIDYVVILSGAAELELDEGRKEPVGPGDCVVQRGTRHAWRVVGDEPLVLCAVLFGAERV